MNEKVYRSPMSTVLNTINDIVELQKGKLTFSDTPHGKIHFLVNMYSFNWEIRFTVADLGGGRSKTRIEIIGDKLGEENMLRREFALLDSMLDVS